MAIQDQEQQKPSTHSQQESKPGQESIEDSSSSSSSAGSDGSASTSEDERSEPSFKVEAQSNGGEGGWQGREENAKDAVARQADTFIEQIFQHAGNEPEKLPSDIIRYDTSQAIDSDEGGRGNSRRRKRPNDSNDDDDQPAEYSQHSFFKESETPKKKKENENWARSMHNTV